ncbi:MAG: PilN domain-containing protein [Wenzhouxiangella sp.]
MSIFSDIQPQLQQLGQRYRGSQLATFLNWWGGELYSLVPERWRGRLVAPRPRLWLLAGSDDLGLSVWRSGAQTEGLDTLGASEDLAALRQRWQAHLASFVDGPPEVCLLLPSELVLEAPVELPLAVESNLTQAVAYQLDQLTPFRTDQVWHDFRVKTRDLQNARLKLDLRLVPKARLEALFERLEAIGIRPHVVDVAPAELQPESGLDGGGFNLLPAERRQVYINRRARLNWGLGVGVIAALALAMFLSLQARSSGVEQLRAEVDGLRNQAESVLALQRELEDALDAANFLAEHRREQPVIMHVLDELTRVLPNDMWLQSVNIREHELILQGQGNGSQRLIELVNGSSLFSEAAFRGSVNIDPNSGQERFNASATITPWGMQDAVAARTQE